MADQAARVAVDFQRIVDETGVTLDTAFNEFVNLFYKEVILTSGVVTGFYRASWFINIGSPVVRTPPPSDVSPDALPPTILARVDGMEASAEDTVYIANGANYAIHVENKYHVVDRTIAKAPRILEDTIRDIKAFQAAFR